MRLDETISQRAIKLIAQELDTGRSRMATVPKRVRDQSRANLPEKLHVYRAIALHDLNPEIKPETGVVSTTTEPSVAVRMANNYPVLMGKDRFISPRPALLHYEIPRDRVHAHVPSMIDQARAEHGDSLKRVKIVGRRSYQKMSVHDVFDQTHREHEVLADVTGLKPNVLQFDNGKHVSAQEKLWAVQDMLHGAPHAKDGASYVQDRKKGHTFYHDDAEAAQEYDDTFRQARKHFRVGLDEAVLRPFRCSCGHSWVDEDTPSGRACHACSGGKGKPFSGESADSLISYVLEGGDDDDLDPKDMLDKGIFDLGVKRQQQGAPKKPSPQTADTRPWAKCSSCGKRHRLRPAFMPWDSRPDSERVNDALCVRCERYHRASLSGD